MTITDPVIVTPYPSRGTFILMRGAETFFDDERRMREWDTAEAALAWAHANLPAYARIEAQPVPEPDWTAGIEWADALEGLPLWEGVK